MSKTGRPSPSLERHRDHLARHENVEASWPQRSLASFFPTTVPTALLHVPGEGDDDVFLESPMPNKHSASRSSLPTNPSSDQD